MPLGLMYVLKVNVRLLGYYMLLGVLGLWLVQGFNFVDGCIKGQAIPFSC